MKCPVGQFAFTSSIWRREQSVWAVVHLLRQFHNNDPKEFNLLMDLILIAEYWIKMCTYLITMIKVKVKWSRYRTGLAQRVGRGIALLCHDRGTRRGWVVSSTPRPQFTPGKDSVSILQEAGWAPGPVWTGGKSRPHCDSIPDRLTRSQSLYRPSYPAHLNNNDTPR